MQTLLKRVKKRCLEKTGRWVYNFDNFE